MAIIASKMSICSIMFKHHLANCNGIKMKVTAKTGFVSLECFECIIFNNAHIMATVAISSCVIYSLSD